MMKKKKEEEEEKKNTYWQKGGGERFACLVVHCALHKVTIAVSGVATATVTLATGYKRRRGQKLSSLAGCFQCVLLITATHQGSTMQKQCSHQHKFHDVKSFCELCWLRVCSPAGSDCTRLIAYG